MVLATGPDLIDDIKKAPDNVLSTSAAKNAVGSASMQNGILKLIKDYPDHSAPIHVRRTKHERQVPHKVNSLGVHARCISGCVQRGPRRNPLGYGRIDPNRGA